tara:strand:+ start:1649 stop:2140 length:492 start_codon:yes stop_codon:yes gene_type:complete
MKSTFSTLVFILLLSMQSQAQLVQGFIKIKEQSKVELNAPSGKAVNLYADFRENKYPIVFSFTCVDVPLNEEKKEVVQFSFVTTVKRDGKVIGTSKRNPIPFFPGDMFMPSETFDFISILSNLASNTPEQISQIPKGAYEITVEAIPQGIKGKIQPAVFFLKL